MPPAGTIKIHSRVESQTAALIPGNAPRQTQRFFQTSKRFASRFVLLHVAEARTRWTLADLQQRQSRPAEALEQLEAAVKNLESFINQNGRAGISNGLLVGLYRRAATLYEESGSPDIATETRTRADALRNAF